MSTWPYVILQAQLILVGIAFFFYSQSIKALFDLFDRQNRLMGSHLESHLRVLGDIEKVIRKQL